MIKLLGRLPERIKAMVGSGLAGWLGKTIRLTDGGFWGQWFGASNFTGKRVTVNSVLQLSAAWACVRRIAGTLSTLPVNMLEEQTSGAKTVARDHPLQRLLHNQPNADMTAAQFWQVFIVSLLLWGGAYVEKRMGASGRTLAGLEFLLPDFVTWDVQANGSVLWHYADPFTRQSRDIAAEAMWFTPFFTVDGFTPLSPVRMGANVFGGAMAADEASASTFTNGMKSSGLVMMNSILNPKQREEIREHVKTVTANGGVFVMEKGADYKQLTMNPQDAELLATRGYNVEEICRWFGVDPSLIGHGSKDSNWGTGLEEKMLWLVTLTLRPIAVLIEQSVRKNLLTPAEQLTFSAEFNLEGLLRGDSKSRAAWYSTMTQNGIMSRDECRAKENLEPMGGNAGVLTVQSNMLPLDKLGAAAPATTAADALKSWLGIEPARAANDD
ncbi:MAG: phage portal protein [Betaproteobacteria bacterium]